MDVGNQRWRNGRSRYRPAGETIRPSDYEVAEIRGDGAARAFVKQHHYSRSYPAARFRYGLYRGGALVGVAVYSHPTRNIVLTNVFPGDVLESVELGRFVLLDDVPGNGESWFLARTFAALRRRSIIGVLSFSDPVARTDGEGRVVFPGHIGTIYQAHNGRYLGRASARTLRILPDGRVLSARALSKFRAQEKGWTTAHRELVAAGAEPFGGGDPRAWLTKWVTTVTRKLRHSGNHKYAWPLDRRVRKDLPTAKPYPKLEVA